MVPGVVWGCGRGLCGARPWWSGTTRWGCQLPVLGSPGRSGGVMLRLGGWGEVGVGCWVGSGDIGVVVGAGGGCWVGSVVGLCGGSVVGVLGGWVGSWVGVGEEGGVPVGVAVGLADGVGVVELVGAGDGVITVGFAVGVGVGGGPSKTPGWRSVGIPWVLSQASPMPSPS